jgi:8-oxo-dGTP pyrophosphatase MutT (NUDIX family)
MHKILQGVWGEKSDTSWEFFVASDLPADGTPSAAMGIPFWKDKIVLTKTKRGWEIPGGHIEDGEDVTACLKRELLEEVGAADIVSERLFGFRKIANPDRKVYATEGKRYPRNTIVPYYLVELGTEPVGPDAPDCFEHGLFDVHDPVIEHSHDRDLLLIGYALRQYLDTAS